VLAVAGQSSNNDKGDVENTTQVLAEKKKQQREQAHFKAPQMDAPVQYTVLAEFRRIILRMHTAHRNLACINRAPTTSPSSRLSLVSYKLLYSSTAATTSRPLARHVLDDLHGQDPVVGPDGFDGLHDEGGSEYFDC
jgi:hypothetical protein